MEKESEKVRLECTVAGKVQNVMYRAFTRRRAEALEVVGFVRNEPDGTVTVVAEGEEKDLELLLASLKKGPFLARVEGVKVEWKKNLGEFQGFAIYKVGEGGV